LSITEYSEGYDNLNTALNKFLNHNRMNADVLTTETVELKDILESMKSDGLISDEFYKKAHTILVG
jgi:hypothetical protein